jgi:hypothetical protein
MRPARAGVPGPGEMMIASGRRASSAAGSKQSLRITSSCAPESRSICWTRL